MIMKKTLSMTLALATVMMTGVVPAFALEYNYSSGESMNLHQSTSSTEDTIANSGTIVVGSDGTIANNTTENASQGPMSSFQLPIGEYPDSWGKETDIAIAQNTMFPNVLAPTTQMTNVPGAAKYDNARINSSALPTPNHSSMNGPVGSASGVSMSGGMGVPTKEAPMEKVSSNGAIGVVSIPKIGLKEQVFENATNESMRKGLGHFSETAGWEGNVAMAGHNRGRYGVFEKLDKLKVGDQIQYTTAYGVKNYQVASISTCSTEDVSGLLQDGTNKLTLYTCVKNNPSIKRMVVAVQI